MYSTEDHHRAVAAVIRGCPQLEATIRKT